MMHGPCGADNPDNVCLEAMSAAKTSLKISGIIQM